MSEQEMRESTDAELYLIKKYGSHRAHYEWRALEDAFNEGRAVGAATAIAQQPAAVVDLPNKWTGCADADTALILIDRIDAPDDQLRLDQLEQIVLKMGNFIAKQQEKGHAE